MNRKLLIIGAIVAVGALTGGIAARDTVSGLWTTSIGKPASAESGGSISSLTQQFVAAEKAGHKSEPGIREPW